MKHRLILSSSNAEALEKAVNHYFRSTNYKLVENGIINSFHSWKLVNEKVKENLDNYIILKKHGRLKMYFKIMS